MRHTHRQTKTSTQPHNLLGRCNMFSIAMLLCFMIVVQIVGIPTQMVRKIGLVYCVIAVVVMSLLHLPSIK